MGGARTPWQYFTDHTEPELAEAVREGRRREFADHGWGPNDVPDPQHEGTVEASRLDWSEPAREPHAGVLAWYRALIALRRSRPELTDARLDRMRVEFGTFDDGAGWLVVHRGGLRVAVNLGPDPHTVPLDAPAAEILLASDTAAPAADGLALGPQSVAVVEVAVVEVAG